jgi:hypothetical protein
VSAAINAAGTSSTGAHSAAEHAITDAAATAAAAAAAAAEAAAAAAARRVPHTGENFVADAAAEELCGKLEELARQVVGLQVRPPACRPIPTWSTCCMITHQGTTCPLRLPPSTHPAPHPGVGCPEGRAAVSACRSQGVARAAACG